MRTLILALALLAASLSADSLALPKLRILAEGGLAETARPFLRELAQTMPEFQMVLGVFALRGPPFAFSAPET